MNEMRGRQEKAGRETLQVKATTEAKTRREERPRWLVHSPAEGQLAAAKWEVGKGLLEAVGTLPGLWDFPLLPLLGQSWEAQEG